MSQDLIYDAREYHVFIPAAFDDLGLTLEAYRVYCHLARRASREGRRAYPSYVKIGEACFRGSYPNSSKASLKAKAIAAVDELIAYGLIRKELHDEGEGYSHNIYHLTPQAEWKKPKNISSCNVRKGRTGLQRNKSVNGDNPPVNPVNPVNEEANRLTGITPPVNRATNSVNPTPPKGITNEGITNEGNTNKELFDFDKLNNEEKCSIADAIACEFEELEVLDVEIMEPEVALPVVSKPKRPRKASKFTAADFDVFWDKTIWKIGKEKTKEKFLAIPQNEPVTLTELIDAWVYQQEWHLKKNGTLQYLKRPESWLYNKRWEDQMEPVSQAGINPKDVAMQAEIARQTERMAKKFGINLEENYAQSSLVCF